jgi:transposase-like protein
MTRQALPTRRQADVVSFIHQERLWTASFGRFADGRVAEVFLDTDKESAVADAAREAALVASIALQFGCPLETLRHALEGRDVSPLGAALALCEPAVEAARAAISEANLAELPLHVQQNGEQ